MEELKQQEASFFEEMVRWARKSLEESEKEITRKAADLEKAQKEYEAAKRRNERLVKELQELEKLS